MDDQQFDALIRQSRELYSRLRSEMWTRWQRDLPIEEMLFDRWERAQNLGFGEGASIYHSSYVYGDVRVGRGTWIGPFTILEGTGGITIGDYCSISSGVQIYTHDSLNWALSGGRAAYDYGPVHIGDCCYIGSQTVISKNVSIGDHTVVGACSFVNRDIPAYSIAFGVPCKVVGKVVIEEKEIQLIYD